MMMTTETKKTRIAKRRMVKAAKQVRPTSQTRQVERRFEA
jgi:hypothetical protein